MSLPLYFPSPIYVTHLTLAKAVALRELCATAGVACKASGAWTSRPVELRYAPEPFIHAEPGGWGAVRVGVPTHHARTRQSSARYGLGALAYGLFDQVARESIKGQPWARIESRGRPKSGKARTPAQRQRQFRAKPTSLNPP